MRAIIASLVLAVALALAAGAQGGPSQRPKCSECHSKNPKLLAMHKALDYSNCRMCHISGVRSMDAMRMTEEEKQNRTTNRRCKACHKK
jgi:lipopolysaccharide biosynthesis regulator YciM